jgi:hypothetical protein
LERAVRVSLVEPDQPVLIFEWQRFPQYGVNDREERNVGSDAQTHDQNRKDGKARVAGESANAEAKIPDEHLQTLPAPGVACLVAEGGGVTKSAERRTAGFFGAVSGGKVLGNLLVEVKLQLVLQLLAGAIAAKQHLTLHEKLP